MIIPIKTPFPDIPAHIVPGTSSGGQREYVEYLVRAAVGAGVDGLFLEVHDNPPEALSDGANMVYLDKLEELLKDALAIYEVVRKKLN